MTTKLQQVGNAAELLVAHWLTSNGHDVFLPYGNSRADIVYADGSRLIKAQVKTGTKVKAGNHEYEQVRLISRGIYNVGSGKYTTGSAYTNEEVDELWVVGTHLWKFPQGVFVGKTSLALGTSRGTPSQKVRTYNPDDYILLRGGWDRPVRNYLCHPA